MEAPQGKKIFVFDRVFGEEVDQEGIWEYLSQSVSSFVQGYNVSLLAYGQSGAGKSYTMGTTGPMEQADPEMMGRSKSYAPSCSNNTFVPPLQLSLSRFYADCKQVSFRGRPKSSLPSCLEHQMAVEPCRNQALGLQLATQITAFLQAPQSLSPQSLIRGTGK